MHIFLCHFIFISQFNHQFYQTLQIQSVSLSAINYKLAYQSSAISSSDISQLISYYQTEPQMFFGFVISFITFHLLLKHVNAMHPLSQNMQSEQNDMLIRKKMVVFHVICRLYPFSLGYFMFHQIFSFCASHFCQILNSFLFSM